MTVAEQLEEQGIKKGFEQTTINLLKAHAPTDLIITATGFTKEKILALAKRFNKRKKKR